ncbi:CoA pyrophosphatase [Altericroceibacterium spongiae]|uniref:CoA pyrophosphatase n=1 Tax=Altericroceibacterium spongiae TaxID=2320269 RepID=A0A420EMQ4_9SPHN|nr:CoA pyrophosphatase [Altericroceibacterium spongiae]RKF21933.1 CoA pyrophosphatase [Altericroceibacterium spongiae]
MSTLLQRLQRLFDEGHGIEISDLRSDRKFAPERLRPAAVLIGVTNRPKPGILFTHRADHMRSHPGQVAFPGGKLDPGEDSIEAALREAQEELSINPQDVTVIGASDRFITGSGFDVTPVLGLVPPDLPLAPNPREVSEWFEAPLDFIFNPANHVEKHGMFRGLNRHYLEINWQGHRIWGVTAAIIANLSRRLAWEELLND